jgi:hypothetical protein
MPPCRAINMERIISACAKLPGVAREDFGGGCQALPVRPRSRCCGRTSWCKPCPPVFLNIARSRAAFDQVVPSTGLRPAVGTVLDGTTVK